MFEPVTSQDNLVSVYLRINPSRFHFLKFILEGYDNLAILSSEKENYGVVRIRTSREQLSVLFNLLECLCAQLK
ncbi:MAG: DUF4911 domain-containing protein [Desulfobulbaceae bacterium]|nr:MAG: DUF4911 domain-containing protein [Desulfobulbaceae bacterium]